MSTDSQNKTPQPNDHDRGILICFAELMIYDLPDTIYQC